LELGSGSFIPGFEEGVVGMSTGETKTLDLTFPEDYHAKELAGKAVQFEVTVNSISENVLPELTDEFVQDVSDEAETVEEYREYVRQKLTEQRESSAKANIQADLMKMAVDNAKCDEDKLPEWLISQNSAEYKSSVESFVSQTGMDLETYLSQSGTDVDTFYKQADDYGREIAKSQLVVKAIADQKGMKITDKELEDYYADYAAEYRTDVDSVRKAIPESELKNYLLQQKVMDHIYNEAVFNR
ncbi:MAG TPA: trigger factor, partial [Lachnospiraceae bacterium]|nr:trigger factor [Lachnospiraceae bacterium]